MFRKKKKKLSGGKKTLFLHALAPKFQCHQRSEKCFWSRLAQFCLRKVCSWKIFGFYNLLLGVPQKKTYIICLSQCRTNIIHIYIYRYIHIFNMYIYTKWIYIYIYNIVVTSPGLLFSHFGSFWLHKKSLVHLVMIILGKVSKAWRGKKSLPGSSLGRGVGMDDDKDFLGSRNTPIF